jgi:hypothetical protein
MSVTPGQPVVFAAALMSTRRLATLLMLASCAGGGTATTKDPAVTADQPAPADELAKAFDFWGVNTYQKENFESVLGDLQNPVGLSFRQLPADTKKPVIFTEIGWPATGREGDAVSGKIKYDDANGANTAKFIERMIGMAYGVKTPEYSGEKKYADLFAGAFYFSFSDEWWKSENPTQWNTTPNLIAENWPNKFNDQEGYGLGNEVIPVDAELQKRVFEGRQNEPCAHSAPSARRLFQEDGVEHTSFRKSNRQDRLHHDFGTRAGVSAHRRDSAVADKSNTDGGARRRNPDMHGWIHVLLSLLG